MRRYHLPVSNITNEAEMIRFETLKVEIPPPRTTSGAIMVEQEELFLIVRDITDVAVELVNSASHRDWLHWKHEPEYCRDEAGTEAFHESEDSDRYTAVSELWTASWWKAEEDKLPKDCPHRKILAIGIASDETLLTMTGSCFCLIPPNLSMFQEGSYTPFTHFASITDLGGGANEVDGHWSGLSLSYVLVLLILTGKPSRSTAA